MRRFVEGRARRGLAPDVVQPNTWLGTSVESETWLPRAEGLVGLPTRVRFLSCEPLLGLLDLRQVLAPADGVNWVIVGGESGPRARPMSTGWVTGIRDQCTSAGIPFFFKQWGGRNKKKAGRVLDGRTWDELPLVEEGKDDGPRCTGAHR